MNDVVTDAGHVNDEILRHDRRGWLRRPGNAVQAGGRRTMPKDGRIAMPGFDATGEPPMITQRPHVASVAATPEGSLVGGSAERQGVRLGGRLERVTVNITIRASRALETLTKLTGDNKTDAINRALQIYAYMEQVAAQGGSVYVREATGSELERLKAF
jgi:hypothetical protein